VDPSGTEVTIRALHRLPPFCMFCGAGARVYRPLRLTREEQWEVLTWLPRFAKIVSMIVMTLSPLSRLMWNMREAGRGDSMEFLIPSCRTCGDAGREPALRQVNWDTSTAIALVHVDFKAHLREVGYR
jgi:hypothetical protein